MPTRTSMSSGEEREPSTSQAWSRRAQTVFVSVAMPVLVLLLVGAPYLLAHYMVTGTIGSIIFRRRSAATARSRDIGRTRRSFRCGG